MEVKDLAWKNEEWRTLCTAEKAQIHCLPPDAVSEATLQHLKPEGRAAVQNSWVGNGFHLPSVCLVLFIVASSVKAEQVAEGIPVEQETSLANRVRNTVLDEYVMIRAPGLLSPEQLFDEVKHMFVSEGELIHAPWEECRQSMSRLPLQRGLASPSR